MGLPIVAITMGDPAGVGPEVLLKALPEVLSFCRPFIIGDIEVLEEVKRLTGLPLQLLEVMAPDEAQGERIPVLSLTHLVSFPQGRPTAEGGEAAYRYILKAVELLKEGVVEAMVTAPISKEALHLAGHPYPGHTELLAELSGTKDYVMMLAGGRLRVALVTTHMALREVPSALSEERIYKTLRITHRALRDYFGIEGPRLAVCALNPHAGEGGLFGDEEEMIRAAVRRARDEGVETEGPLPADSLFFYAAQGKWDGVVAMYHDQGLIPLKLLHFRDGVNITLGLPFVRTSVDHGTAYEIAGKGVADPSSMISAIKMAAEIIRRRRER